jgi:succinoglycan biosynthesis transport protein ExoP
LESALEQKETELAGLIKQFTASNPKVRASQGEKEYLLSALAARRQETNRLPERERQLAALKLNVDLAEQIYELIKVEYEEAQIRGARENREMRVVSPATAPLSPSKPIRVYYAGAAFAMALFAGIALAVLLESRNAKS